MFNTKQTTEENIYNIKTENNQINQISNTNETAQVIHNSTSGSKLLAFIKSKPLFFTLIVIGITGVIVVAIVVPVILINKIKSEEITLQSNINENINDNTDSINESKNNNEESKNNNEESKNNNEESKNNNEESNNNNDDLNNIIFDFSNVNINSQYNSIGEKSNSLDTFCQHLGGIALNFNNDKEKVYLIYKWVAENIEYDYEKYKNKEPVECEPAQVLINKKTVCS